MVSDAENLHPSSNSAVSSGHTYCMKDKQQQDEDEQVEKNGGNPFVGGAPSWLDNKLAAGAPAWPFPLLDSSSSSSLSPSSSSLSSFSSPWSWSSCLCNSPPRWEGQDSAGLSSIRAPVEEQSEEEGELVEGLVEETEEYQDLPGCNFASVSHPISIACYQSWRNQLSTNSGRLQSQSVFQLDEEEDMDIVQSIFAARSQQFSNPSRLIEDGSIDPQRFVNARQQLEDRGLKARGPIFLASSPVSWESSFNSSMLAMNFLGACFFCHSLLSQGKDIYMYRGDCAFCSLECRYQQIALDELNEKSHQEHFASLVSLDVQAKPWHQL